MRDSAGLAGFAACQSCGKLIVAPIAADRDPSLAPPIDPDKPLAEQPKVADVVIPDFHEIMVGWRAWGVKADVALGDVPLLRSVTYGSHHWNPREPMEATCRAAEKRAKRNIAANVNPGRHECPSEGCSCGLYSAKTREHLQGMAYHRYDAEGRGMFHVIGEVALWGKVIEGTQGWRAQYGYPRRLYVPFEAWHLAEPLAEAYGCPVELNNILTSTKGT